MLRKFVEVAICTNKEMDIEKKAEELLKTNMSPHFIPVLTEMNEKELNDFVKKYDGKLDEQREEK